MGSNTNIKQVPRYQDLLILLEQVLDLLREKEIESDVTQRIEIVLEQCS